MGMMLGIKLGFIKEGIRTKYILLKQGVQL